MQRQFEPATQRRGGVDGPCQLRWVPGISQAQIGAEVIEAERGKEGSLALRQCPAVTRHAESKRRQPSLATIFELDPHRVVVLVDGRWRSRRGDRHFLPDPLAGFDREEPAPPRRVRLGFERGVGPVALIFELERVSLVVETGGDIAGELHGETLHRREDGDLGLIGDELRGHLDRKPVGDGPLRGYPLAGASGVLMHPVMDIESNQLIGHVGAGDGVHGVADDAIRRAQDLAVPDQIDVVLAVRHREADRELVLTLLDGEV